MLAKKSEAIENFLKKKKKKDKGNCRSMLKFDDRFARQNRCELPPESFLQRGN